MAPLQNFVIKHFLTLPVGKNFVVDGVAYTKIGDLTFRDSTGIEQNIDPLFDAKLGKVLDEAAERQKPPVVGVDTTAPSSEKPNVVNVTTGLHQVSLPDADVERIAQRVAEILKGTKS